MYACGRVLFHFLTDLWVLVFGFFPPPLFSFLQVYHLVQQNLAAQRLDNVKRQVLVTAPSNVAVDQLVEKIHLAGLNVVRLTSKTRESETTHVEYLCLHKMVPDANPEVKKLMQLRDEMGTLSDSDQRRFLRLQR